MRISTAAKLLAILCCLGAPSPSWCADDFVRIGSYNVRYFGRTDPSKRSLASSAEEIGAVASRIAEKLEFDIAVLQEIDVTSQGWRQLRLELASRGFSVGFEGRDGGKNRANLVIVYREEKAKLVRGSARHFSIRALDRYGTSKSKCRGETILPVKAAFEVKGVTFVVIGLHLRPRFEIGGIPDCDNTIRLYQAGIVAGYARELVEAGGEVVIAGDFNAEFDLSPRPNELAPFTRAGFQSAQLDRRKGSATHSWFRWENGHTTRRMLIDHVLFNAKSNRFIRNSGHVMPVARSEQQRYFTTQSDHVPVHADFRLDNPAP